MTAAALSLLALGSMPITYRVVDLGTLPSRDTSSAIAVTDSGHVAGISSDGGSDVAFLWSRGSGMTQIGPLGRDRSTAARAASDPTMVVGRSSGLGGGRAWYWNAAEGLVDLATRAGLGSSSAEDVNGQGVIVGVGRGATEAFRWSAADGLTWLGTLPGGDVSFALGVNQAGVIVGLAVDAARRTTPFIWRPLTGMTALQTPPGMISASALDVTDSEIIAIEGIDGRSSPRAFVRYADGRIRDVGILPGGSFAAPRGIAEGPRLVGSGDSANGSRGWIWTERDGLRDLNTALDRTGAGWTIVQADDVNSSGQIAATGVRGGQLRAVLLVPNPPRLVTPRAIDP